jgi:hypothetical protein
MPRIDKLSNFNEQIKLLTGKHWKGVVRKEISKGVRLAAEVIRRNVVLRIRRGEHKKLHPYTLALRQYRGHSGTRPLNETGTLSRNVTVILDGLDAYVGLVRGASSSRGAAQANIARLQESGYMIRVTNKMRKFFKHRRLRLKLSTTHLRVPARPFMKPALEDSEQAVRLIMAEAAKQVLETIRVQASHFKQHRRPGSNYPGGA